MICFFCKDPAAHEATGTRYTADVLACHACTIHFWTWWKQFNYGKGSRRARRIPVARSFYECAADHVDERIIPR